METQDNSPLLDSFVGKVVVVDLISTYVCLGTLAGYDPKFLEIRDADFHDFRDSTATREVYVHDSVRLGIPPQPCPRLDSPRRDRRHHPVR